jgi:hypothetical protein
MPKARVCARIAVRHRLSFIFSLGRAPGALNIEATPVVFDDRRLELAADLAEAVVGITTVSAHVCELVVQRVRQMESGVIGTIRMESAQQVGKLLTRRVDGDFLSRRQTRKVHQELTAVIQEAFDPKEVDVSERIASLLGLLEALRNSVDPGDLAENRLGPRHLVFVLSGPAVRGACPLHLTLPSRTLSRSVRFEGLGEASAGGTHGAEGPSDIVDTDHLGGRFVCQGSHGASSSSSTR